MSKYRKSSDSTSTDKNEPEIIEALEKIGCYVISGYNDLLVYYKDELFHIEVKTHNPVQKNGKIKANFIKDSQYKFLWNANNNYVIIWDANSSVNYVQKNGGIVHCITPDDFKKNYKNWLTMKELNRLRIKNIIND